MRKDKPCLSIGMPVFNGENYIKESLDSILAQTYSDFELIISDNTSTDRTEEICRAYAAKDRRIRYYRNEHNLGGAWNFNRVFALSVGEYFKWAAHDDVCAPELLEKCVESLDRDHSAVLCYSKAITIDEHGNHLGEELIKNMELNSAKPHERFHKFLSSRGYHAVFGVIRRSALKKTSLIDNYIMSDRTLLGQLSILGKFYEIKDYLFYLRRHPEASSVANKTDIALSVWHDPKYIYKIPFPRWRRYFEMLRFIDRAGLSPYEQACCYYMYAGVFVLVPRIWIKLTGDLVKAIKRIGRLWHSGSLT